MMRISKMTLLMCILSITLGFQIYNGQYIGDSGLSMEANSYRSMIIRENMKLIQNHNKYGDSSFKLKPYSQFIALTHLQAKSLFFMDKKYFQSPPSSLGFKIEAPKIEKKKPKLFYYVDLSNKYPTPVQNQGYCGNCYAHSTTDTTNMIYMAANKGYPNLSPQHLTDCTKGTANDTYNNGGCIGGYLYTSYKYMYYNGVYSNDTYPLNGQTVAYKTEQPCKTYPGKTTYPIIKLYSFGNNTECYNRVYSLSLGNAITIGVSASHPNFMYYKQGVVTTCNGSSTVDHAVVLVGAYYDYNNMTTSYLKIKNSWGLSWGESGYIRISLGGNNCFACHHGYFPGV